LQLWKQEKLQASALRTCCRREPGCGHAADFYPTFAEALKDPVAIAFPPAQALNWVKARERVAAGTEFRTRRVGHLQILRCART
jgi:hypothetical protein